MKKIIFLLLQIFFCTFIFSQSYNNFIKNVVDEVNNSKYLEIYAHELLDKIGPRLVGTPQMKYSNDWLINKYKSIGISAKNEQYGTWKGWERGITHVDLLSPRVKTLEAMQLAWSPSTNGKTITGSVIILPLHIQDSLSLQQWLPKAKGKFVLISANPLTGIPKATWDEYAIPGDYDALKALERKSMDSVTMRMNNIGRKTFFEMLDRSGALGILSLYWSEGYGANKIFSAYTKKTPVLDISLEDYSLLYRLAKSNSNPVVSVKADSKMLGNVPVYNTIATISGGQKANEYVILSAHLDSWDGASGATDNGTGTILILEAMRILKKFYPNPKRTIIAGHWNSEEQGLNGSRAFVEDHPEIIKNIQAVFNQDNGTGRVVNISGQGFKDVEKYLTSWLAAVPDSITKEIKTNFPGKPGGGGSDYASFVALKAPAFSLTSTSWNYGIYTWHTNRDTYDKIVFQEIKRNAILVAILVYMACEDENSTPHEFVNIPVSTPTTEAYVLPQPKKARRTSDGY